MELAGHQQKPNGPRGPFVDHDKDLIGDNTVTDTRSTGSATSVVSSCFKKTSTSPQGVVKPSTAATSKRAKARRRAETVRASARKYAPKRRALERYVGSLWAGEKLHRDFNPHSGRVPCRFADGLPEPCLDDLFDYPIASDDFPDSVDPWSWRSVSEWIYSVCGPVRRLPWPRPAE